MLPPISEISRASESLFGWKVVLWRIKIVRGRKEIVRVRPTASMSLAGVSADENCPRRIKSVRGIKSVPTNSVKGLGCSGCAGQESLEW